MGYYVTLIDANAVLPAAALDEAYKRLCDLNKRDELKKGGSSSGEKWFSWMPTDYPEQHTTAAEILGAVGFSLYDNGAGGLGVYEYDNKTGCEDVFIWAIADLFEADNYMTWRGEDGLQWRWQFGGGQPMRYSNGSVVWNEESLYEPINWPAMYASWGLSQ